MSDEPRYNERMTMSEYRIAACDEIDLEAIVWKGRAARSSLLQFASCEEADKAALREIDRLKIAGIYEAERARLAARLDPQPGVFAEIAARLEAGELGPLNNFLRGLRSPDPDQRARFERLYEQAELAGKSPRECWRILSCLEPARKPPGRPSATPPWRNVVQHLDAMRLAVAGGASIPQAARDAAAGEGRAEEESRARYFEKLYRQRAALRE
ncbi:hypothetical protein [Rhodosalinus sp. K401]|uniref:hypothetical protein n=1 Tax=Rhodosalinus sp. K401 TaxID=3239195 RepID=UPI003523920E